MNPVQENHPSATDSIKPLAVWLLWGVVAIGAILLAYQYGLFGQFLGSSENGPILLRGRILMNLSNADADTAAYVFDAETRSLRPFDLPYLMPRATADEQAIIGTGHIDDDGITKASVLLARNRADSDDILYATSSIPILYNASISPDGTQYTFEVPPEDDELIDDDSPVLDPSNWSIYLGSVEGGDPQLIAHGTYAHFSPDGVRILYTGREGFRIYDTALKTDTLVVPVHGGIATIHFRSDVSGDGKSFAMTNAPRGEVVVWDIASWNPFTLVNEQAFALHAFWPVLSFNGRQLAVQQVDWHENDPLRAPDNARLTIIDRVTERIEDVADLAAFDQESLFVSEWLTK